jgi:ribosomal protein S27AE
MAEFKPADKSLQCASCGDGFVFSRGEQELYRLRGITSDPTQCPNCAHGRVVASLGPQRTNDRKSA